MKKLFVLLSILFLIGSVTFAQTEKTVKTDNKKAKIEKLNSLQSVTAQGVAEGVTYYGVMEQNLEVLKQALGDGK